MNCETLHWPTSDSRILVTTERSGTFHDSTPYGCDTEVEYFTLGEACIALTLLVLTPVIIPMIHYGLHPPLLC